MLCPRCNGQKYISKVDIIRAKTVMERCPDCHGTGQKDAAIPDGVYVKPEPGVLHYWSKYVGGRVVAHIQTVIEKVQPPHGKIIKSEPYFVVSILNMKTRNKDRKKGYCGELIDSIQKWCNASVKYILTSWDDSSEMSRVYLMKRGFVRNKSVLVWRRNEPAEKGRSDGKGNGSGDTSAGGDNSDSKANGTGDSAQLGGDPQGAGSPAEVGANGAAHS